MQLNKCTSEINQPHVSELLKMHDKLIKKNLNYIIFSLNILVEKIYRNEKNELDKNYRQA